MNECNVMNECNGNVMNECNVNWISPGFVRTYLLLLLISLPSSVLFQCV